MIDIQESVLLCVSDMCISQFIQQNGPNILSIILSGILSWMITFYYFVKANRKEAYILVIEPIKLLLSKFPNNDDVIEFKKYNESFVKKHLKKSSRQKVSKLFELYYKISDILENELKAEALKKHFFTVLDNRKIEYKIEPLRDYDGEIVAYITPIDMEHILDDIEKVLSKEEHYDSEPYILNELNKLFNWCLNRYVKSDKIDFFKYTDMKSIFFKDEKYKNWMELIENYRIAKKDFLEIRE